MVKILQTVAAMACMKTLLMAFNFIFWCTGIAILAIGIWMKVELYKYMEISTEFSSSSPYVLIITGVLIIIIGSLACCCTIKGQPTLLYIYGAFLVIVFVLELGAGVSIYAYRNRLKNGFDKGFSEAMSQYRNDTHLAKDLDLIQSTLHCCGNHNSTDWLNLKPPMAIPSSCCNVPDCDTADDKKIYSQGCYNIVIDFLQSNIGTIAGSAVAIAFFPLIGVFLSCCLASVTNKMTYEQMA